MDSETLSHLVHDIDFRLAMKKAARSDQPLPPKVLRWLAQDDEFHALVEKAMNSMNFECRGNLRLLLKEEKAKVELLAGLEKDERVALLLAEVIERYNHTMKVLSGLRSRLRSLFEDKNKTSFGDKDKTSVTTHSTDWSWLNYLNPSQPNPLLNLGLVGALGISTIGGTALGYKFVKEFHEVTTTIHDSQMTTKEFGDKLRKEVHDQLIREVPIIVQQGAPQRTEIRLVEVPCRNCTNSSGTLTGTLSLQVPEKLPEFRVAYDTPLTLASTPAKLDEKTGKIIDPAGLSFNVNGLPAFPSSLTIPPTYRLDNPPPSTTTLGPETKLQVRYPANSYTATTCPVSFTRNGDELTGTFGKCTPDNSVKKPGTTFSVPIPKDNNWVFVPEADALIRVEHLRTGFLGLGKTDLRISMQAAPYAPMLAQTPGPQPAASAMNRGAAVGP